MSILIIFVFSLVIKDNYTFSTELIQGSKDAIYVHSLIYDKNTKKIDFSKFNEEDNKQKNNELLKGVLSPVVSRMNLGKSPLYNFSYSLKLFFYNKDINSGLISLVTAIISLLVLFFIKLIIEIGKNRFFLESRIYNKTNVVRLLFPYKTKCILNLSIILFLKKLYQTLWSITIVMGFVKIYEYKMIPYILAENPTIKRKEAFLLSKEMMDGYKWQAFKLDLSFIGWYIIGMTTLGFSNTLFFNPYREFVYAELYYQIRNNKLKTLTNKDLLNDKYLFKNNDELEEYPDDKLCFPIRKIKINTNYDQKYSIKNLILIFFTAAFIGYSWEVILHLVTEGEFVNRGTMFGPWLPIYGSGSLLILLVLKPVRKIPFIFFISAMLLAGIVEYGTAWFLETFAHMKWWDYTGFFLNIHGRVCLEGLLIFGLGGSAITYFIGPILNNLFNKIKAKTLLVICFILFTLFGVDVVYSINNPNTGEGITSN